MEDPRKKLQEANGLLRNAQNHMFSGKNQEAVELLNKAEEQGRLAEAQIPDDFQLRSLYQKIEKLRKDLERKGVATRKGGNTHLPFEVQAQLSRIRDHVVKKELDWAKKELDTFYAKNAGSYSHLPELDEYKQHIAKLEIEQKQAAAQKARENQARQQAEQHAQELSRIWEEKLRGVPYFDGTSRNVQALMLEQANCKRGEEVLAAFKEVTFPGQPSITVESLQRDVESRIIGYRSNLPHTISLLADQLTRDIEDRIEFLNQDTAWQTNPTQKPYIISDSEMNQFVGKAEELKPLFEQNPEGMEAVTHAINQLTEINQARKNERSKLTTMKPEAMTGAEAQEAIHAATKALALKYPRAKVNKSAAIRRWEEKQIEEWADSTPTQWIKKNTRETTVQISAEVEPDNLKLFTLHVENDINADGSHGQARSHIMHEEQMANPSVV